MLTRVLCGPSSVSKLIFCGKNIIPFISFLEQRTASNNSSDWSFVTDSLKLSNASSKNSKWCLFWERRKRDNLPDSSCDSSNWPGKQIRTDVELALHNSSNGFNSAWMGLHLPLIFDDVVDQSQGLLESSSLHHSPGLMDPISATHIHLFRILWLR